MLKRVLVVIAVVLEIAAVGVLLGVGCSEPKMFKEHVNEQTR